MIENRSAASAGDAWYTNPGADNDVVLSSRVRFARNLANFPFPEKLQGDDALRVQSLVFDAFNNLPDGSSYQAINVSHLDGLGYTILKERGVMEQFFMQDSGIIIRNDGRVSCTVNMKDHVRIMAFAPGFGLEEAADQAAAVDHGLQEKLQFAASYDFGYLTSSVLDAGSGLKISLRLHLPCLSMLGKIRCIASDCQQQKYDFKACFGSGLKGASLGCYYYLGTVNALSGSEFDQMTSFLVQARQIIEKERNARSECSSVMLTSIRNIVYRSLALARSSLLINIKEAIDIISGIKLGLSMKLLDGIDDSNLNALLYRIQDGHLEYVLRNGDFRFENDISSALPKKNERLRALILQEAFEKINLI